MLNFEQNISLYDCSESIREKSFWIKDSENGFSEICTSVDGQLFVINKFGITVDFLKIDSCVYSPNDEERCDCSLSTTEKIYFIEFKEKEDFSNNKSKRRSRKKAISQLASTINNFKLFNIDLLNSFGVIVLTPKLPHSHRQIVSACHQSEIAEMFLKSGCPNLLIGNILNI